MKRCQLLEQSPQVEEIHWLTGTLCSSHTEYWQFYRITVSFTAPGLNTLYSIFNSPSPLSTCESFLIFQEFSSNVTSLINLFLPTQMEWVIPPPDSTVSLHTSIEITFIILHSDFLTCLTHLCIFLLSSTKPDIS